MNRKYEEFVERLGVEMVYDYIEILPCIETKVVGDEVIKDDNITYLIMTNYTKGDRTIPVSYTHLDVYKRQVLQIGLDISMEMYVHLKARTKLFIT